MSTHQLTQVLGRPPRLGKGQAALDALEELPGGLVGHDVGLFPVAGLVEFLPGRALVDADHGDADGPGGLPDGQGEVPVVGLDVPPGLGRPDDLADGVEQGVVEVGPLEPAEQGGEVFEDLKVRGVGGFSRGRGLDGRVPRRQRRGPLGQQQREVRRELAVEVGVCCGVTGWWKRRRDQHVPFGYEFEGRRDGSIAQFGFVAARQRLGGSCESVVSPQARRMSFVVHGHGFVEGSQFGP